MDLRSRLLAVPLALLGAAGCSGQLVAAGGPDGGDAPDANALKEAARREFDANVQPLLAGFCSACHTATGVVGFLAPQPDVYTSVTTWPLLVDVDSPRDSRLLTKGVHDGPAWTLDQAATIRAWIELEASATGNPVEPEPETQAFAVLVGINTVDLGSVGLPGSTLTFRAEKLTVGLYLSEIMVSAGAGGAHLVHPLFVRWVAGVATPDPVDSFADIDLTVPEATSAMVGGGTLVLVDLPPEAQLSVHFAVAEPAVPGPGPGPGGDGDGDGGPIGGCAAVAAFTASAQPRLAASCASCHAGGDSQATNATDMTSINDLSPAGQAAACGQILSRVNLADPINSGIFIAPDPGSGASHQFKFAGDAAAFQDFRGALLVWIAQE